MGASNFDAKVSAAIEAVRGRSLPGTAKMMALVGIVWGVAGFGYGLVSDPAWAWGALLVAVFYWMGVSQGGIMYGVIMQGTKARWGRPLKRIAESFGFYLPVLWVLLAVFLVGGATVYPWHPSWINGTPVELAPHGQGALPAKEFWLTPTFFIARQLGYLGLLIVLNFVFLRNSLAADLIKAKGVLGGDAPSWWGRFTGGGTDAAAAAEKGAYRNEIMVPVMGFAYAILFSLLSFDLIMSLDPWWFSNMFGGWIFMSCILLGLATIAVFVTLGRDWLSLGDWATPNVTLDLGKLMLAGTMFWAYTLFAQILPIWYTNVPEETNFLLVRMMLEQWSWMARLVAILCFIAPFTILLSRGIKKMRWPFMGIALLILTGFFFERSLLVLPSVYLGDAFPWGTFFFVSMGVFAGVTGGFVLVVGKVLSELPAVPVGDPLLEDHPWDVHVHALHPAGDAH